MASVGDASNRAAAFVGKMSMKGIDSDLKFEAKQSGGSTHVYVKTGASWLGIAAKLGISSAVKERNEMRAEAFKQIKADFTKTYGAEISNKIFPIGEGAKSISVGQLKSFHDLAERMKQNEGTTTELVVGGLKSGIDVAAKFEQLKTQGNGPGSPVETIRERAMEFAKSSGGDPVSVFKEVGTFMNASQTVIEGQSNPERLRAEIDKFAHELSDVVAGKGEYKDLGPDEKLQKIDNLTNKINLAKDSLHKATESLKQAPKTLETSLLKHPEGGMKALLQATGRGAEAVFKDNHLSKGGLFERPMETVFKENLAKIEGNQFDAFKKLDLKSFSIMLVQYPPRLELFSRELMKGLDPAPTTDEGWAKAKTNLGKLANEMMTNYSTQIESFRIFSEAVRDPRLTEGMSTAQKQNLKELGDAAADMVRAMSDPDGPIQGLLSFATIAASDPKQAVEMLKGGQEPVVDDVAPKTDDPPVIVKSDEDPPPTVSSGVKPDDSPVSDDPPTTTVTSDPPPIQVQSPPPPPLTTGIEFLSDLDLGDAVTKRLSDGVKTGSLQERDLIFAFGKLTNDPRGQFTPLDIIRGMDLSKAATDEFIYRALTGGFDMDAGKMMFQIGDYGTDKLGGRDAAPFQKIDDAVRLTTSLTKEQGDQLKVDLMTGRLTPQKLDDSLRAALFGTQFAPIRG